MRRHLPRQQKQKRLESLRTNERRQKESFAVPGDAERCSYDVIPRSSRLGARPNPLANWKHAILCYWSAVIRKRSDPVFGGLVSTSPLVGSDRNGSRMTGQIGSNASGYADCS